MTPFDEASLRDTNPPRRIRKATHHLLGQHLLIDFVGTFLMSSSSFVSSCFPIRMELLSDYFKGHESTDEIRLEIELTMGSMNLNLMTSTYDDMLPL